MKTSGADGEAEGGTDGSGAPRPQCTCGVYYSYHSQQRLYQAPAFGWAPGTAGMATDVGAGLSIEPDHAFETIFVLQSLQEIMNSEH